MQPHCQSRVGAIRRGMGSRVLELQAMHTAVAPHRQGGPTPPPGPWAVGWPRGCGLHMDTVERASLGSAAGSTQQSAACAASSPLPGSPVCHSPREGQEGGVGTGPCCRCCRMAPSSRRSVSAAARRNEERLEEKHLVLLRDGRTLIGFLRSIDQFANLVLHQTVERIHVGKKYGDIPRGIFVVRGENVVLLGEIDLEKESDTLLQQVSIEEILEEQRVELQAKQESEKLKVQALKERGLAVPRADTLDEY